MGEAASEDVSTIGGDPVIPGQFDTLTNLAQSVGG